MTVNEKTEIAKLTIQLAYHFIVALLHPSDTRQVSAIDIIRFSCQEIQ
jgi:hypothetical protein